MAALSCSPSIRVAAVIGSPDAGSFCSADLEKVVLVLQQEVVEDQSDGVPGLRQDGPGAVQVVVVLCRISGAAY